MSGKPTKLGMGMASQGDGKSKTKGKQAENDRHRAFQVQQAIRYAYFKEQEQKDAKWDRDQEKMEANLAAWKVSIDAQWDDPSLPTVCRHGNEGLTCKFGAGCRFWHGACPHNLAGNICVPATQDRCGMQHAPGQENFPYKKRVCEPCPVDDGAADAAEEKPDFDLEQMKGEFADLSI